MSDNVQAGKLLAEDLLQRKSSARIAIIDHLSAKSALDRVKGFSSIISEKNTYKIVARFSSDGNIEQALLGIENILKLRTQVDVAFATNDPSAMGVLAALEAVQLTGKVLVYGVDGAPYAKRMILEGKMTATVAQSPVEIGRTAAEMTYQLLKGKEIKRTILVPVFLIKAEKYNSMELMDGNNCHSYDNYHKNATQNMIVVIKNLIFLDAKNAHYYNPFIKILTNLNIFRR
jgi:ribose transport system substrate-binding protein